MKWEINIGRDSERIMLWPRTLSFIERYYPKLAVDILKEENSRNREKQDKRKDSEEKNGK